MLDYASIRKTLLERLQTLGARMESMDDSLESRGDDDVDAAVSDAEEDEVMERVGRRSMAEIAGIRGALDRLDHGEYGICVECRGPISEDRLRALPHATHCIDCAADA